MAAREMHYTATFQERLYPRGACQHLSLRSLAGRHGFCGMSWNIFPSLHRWCKFSLYLCRRWWISCRTLSNSFVRSHLFPEQVIEVPKILPFDVPLRTAVRVPQLAEQLVEVPSIICFCLVAADCGAARRHSSPWWWRTKFWSSRYISSGQSLTATPSSKKRISERIVEQIVDPVSSGGLHGSRPGQEFIFFSLSSWCSRAR